MKTVTINNNTYKVKNIDFDAICELEDIGFDFKAVKSKPFSTIRSAVAFHLDMTVEESSKEIENHIKNGGKIDDLYAFIETIVEGDFFKLLAENAKKEN